MKSIAMLAILAMFGVPVALSGALNPDTPDVPVTAASAATAPESSAEIELLLGEFGADDQDACECSANCAIQSCSVTCCFVEADFGPITLGDTASCSCVLGIGTCVCLASASATGTETELEHSSTAHV